MISTHHNPSLIKLLKDVEEQLIQIDKDNTYHRHKVNKAIYDVNKYMEFLIKADIYNICNRFIKYNNDYSRYTTDYSGYYGYPRFQDHPNYYMDGASCRLVHLYDKDFYTIEYSDFKRIKYIDIFIENFPIFRNKQEIRYTLALRNVYHFKCYTAYLYTTDPYTMNSIGNNGVICVNIDKYLFVNKVLLQEYNNLNEWKHIIGIKCSNKKKECMTRLKKNKQEIQDFFYGIVTYNHITHRVIYKAHTTRFKATNPGYENYSKYRYNILYCTDYKKNRLFSLIDQEQCFLEALLKQFPKAKNCNSNEERTLLNSYRHNILTKLSLLRMKEKQNTLAIYLAQRNNTNIDKHPHIRKILELQNKLIDSISKQSTNTDQAITICNEINGYRYKQNGAIIDYYDNYIVNGPKFLDNKTNLDHEMLIQHVKGMKVCNFIAEDISNTRFDILKEICNMEEREKQMYNLINEIYDGEYSD